MMMNRYVWVAAVTALVLTSCSKKRLEYHEIRDKDLVIRFGSMVSQADEPRTIKIRLIPSPRVFIQLDKQAKENLIYRMDSCFYTGDGKKVVYPSIVQPIATGAEKTFEYMISFDDMPGSTAATAITYQDRYMNKKKYKLILQPQE